MQGPFISTIYFWKLVLPDLLCSASFRLFKQRTWFQYPYKMWYGPKGHQIFIMIALVPFLKLCKLFFPVPSLAKDSEFDKYFLWGRVSVYKNMIHMWKVSHITHLLKLTHIFYYPSFLSSVACKTAEGTGR